MKPTPELINDWHEKARQMALQADGYFDDVEHWRHFAELAAAWGAEQTTGPLRLQIRRAIAAEDELRATKQTLEHAYAALQKVADAQAAIEEPELPEAAVNVSPYDPNHVYWNAGHSNDGVNSPLFTAAQMHDHFAAGVRAGMGQSQDALGYAQRLAKSIASKEYPEVTQFEVLGDLMGVLSQIDNMTCGMTRVLQGGQQ